MPRTLEPKFRGWGAYSKKHRGWHEALLAAEESLLLDLSDVTFAEFESLATLLVLVESAVRHGISTTVLLPAASASDLEMAILNDPAIDAGRRHRRAEAVRLRRATHTFMDHVGFKRALELPHVPEALDLLSIDEPGVQISDDEPDADPDVEEVDIAVSALARPASVLPFRWLTAADLADGDQWITQVAQVLARAEETLDEGDARQITRGMLWELVENVRLHAGHLDTGHVPPAALLGAIALNAGRGRRYVPRPEQFLGSLGSYVDWVRERPTKVFRAVVADGGSGIERTLSVAAESAELHGIPMLDPSPTDVEKVLFWSFHALSTRVEQPRLGVRGLALVDRFARAYSGSVTIRSSDASIGYVNLGSDRLPVREPGLRSIPGTVVSLTALGSEARHRRVRGEWHSNARKTQRVIVLDGDQHLESELLASEADKQLAHGEGEPTVVVAFSDEALKKRSPLDVANELSRLAVGLSSQCGRVAVAIADASIGSIAPYLKAYEDAWEVGEQTAEEEAMLRALQVPSIPDPLLVVGADGDVTWWGGREDVRQLLYALLEAEGGRLRRDEVSSRIEGTELDLDGPVVSDWVNVDEATVALTISPGSIEEALRAEGLTQLRREAEASAKSSGPTVTASLEPVAGWPDLGAIMRKPPTAGLVAQTVARLAEDAVPETGGVVVAFAEPSLARLAQTVALRLNVSPHRTAVHRSLEDISHADVPSSEATCLFLNGIARTGTTAAAGVRRLLKDRFGVCGALSIIDAADVPLAHLECLSRLVPHAAALHWPIASAPRRRIDLKDRRRNEFGDALHALELLEHSTRCLDIGHVVGSGGRHFGCYVYPEPFQEGSRFLEATLAKLVAEVDSWLGEVAPPESRHMVDLWFPDDDPDLVGGAAARFASILNASGIDTSAHPVRRSGDPGAEAHALSRNIVVFDWGAVTSRTVAHLTLAIRR